MTSAAANANKRFVTVTQGNLKNNHVSVRGHLDFFPSDCVGSARRITNSAKCIEIVLDGLNQTINTDLPKDAKTGKPRGILRERTAIGSFFKHHHVQAGDTLTIERLTNRRYRLVAGTNGNSNGQKPRAAEFFAGIGLVRLALEHQGWDVVFANDIDEDKAKMYRHNWPEDDHLIIQDIHKLHASDIPDCDLATASFPCNDLSIAGKWEGLNGKESSAFWGFIRLLREMGKRRPPLVMLENVVGFLLRHGGRDLEEALNALNELGYCVDAAILNAKHWTPQSRARLFIIGRLKEARDRRTLAPISDARPEALTEFIYGNQHIRWDIRELPPLPPPTSHLADIVEDLPNDDPHWWNEKRTNYFMRQLSPRHAKDARAMIEGKMPTYATAFRRVRNEKSMAELRTDGIAGCLRTPRGGSGRQILFKAGRGRFQVRLLTARECARLQGVPDDFKIDVPLNKALFGFGDAVCVPVVEWISSYCLFPAISSLSDHVGNVSHAGTLAQ